MSEILDRSSEIGDKFLAWTPETGPCPMGISFGLIGMLAIEMVLIGSVLY